MTDSSNITQLSAAQLTELELLARGKSQKSRTIKDLGKNETPEEAHKLLLELSHWDELRTPYAERFGAQTTSVDLALPELDVPVDSQQRLDLTHLPAFAIDDEGNQDPDDAISLEQLDGGMWRLWVHVADVAGLVAPESALDLEARNRGATLYLPDATYGMLPDELVAQLGLGMQEISPALSIMLELDAEGNADGVDVHLTRIKVERISYQESQRRLEAGDATFSQLAKLHEAIAAMRKEDGAINIDLPEVKVKVEPDGQTTVAPLPKPHMRLVVQECMTLAGWASAIFADDEEISLPFAAQDVPSHEVAGDDLVASWARRKTLSRTRFQAAPAPHSGMGLDLYTQATSPMRRYLDLVVHQQIRAFLLEHEPLTGQAIAARIAESQQNTSATRLAERNSRRHHLLRYIAVQPERLWHGVVVERRGARATVLMPELALDVQLTIPHKEGSQVTLRLLDVDLPNLSLRGRLAD